MSTTKKASNKAHTKRLFSSQNFMWGTLIAVAGLGIYFVSFSDVSAVKYSAAIATTTATTTVPEKVITLDIGAYKAKLNFLAHVVPAVGTTTGATTTAAQTSTTTGTTTARITQLPLWPAKVLVYPKAGALLPFDRIVAYYGNFYSKGMGVLGQYPPGEMISRLNGAVAEWQIADPLTKVIPAIDYIAVTAQGSAGADGMYRLRMPDSEIEKAIDLAKQVNGIVILDVQVGKSTIQAELPPLEKYLILPQVHLALDPEFSMKTGQAPGTVIGTMNAGDINYAANFLAALVKEYDLPPKVLIIHRFTEDMVTGYRSITQLPEVQFVMDMDGWGSPAKKTGTYNQVIYPEPVEFTGFKLFYKNDLKAPSTRMMTPAEVLKLTPSPSFIQYQ